MATGPTVRLEVDQSSLRQLSFVLRRYAKQRKMDNADVLNRAGMQAAYSAGRNTRKASAEEISAALKRQVSAVKMTRTGKVSKDQTGTYEATTYGMVQMLIKMRRGTLFYKGFPNATDPRQYSRDELKAMALRYINRRISSAGFIAAGWKRGYQAFRAAYKGSGAGTSLREFRKYPGKGGATIARPGDKSEAVLWDASATKDPTSGPALKRYGTAGLNQALIWVKQDMLKYLNGQLKQRATEANRGR
jgi:hypothetical protein